MNTATHKKPAKERQAPPLVHGPMSGSNLLGEVTEALHRFLLDGYDISDQPPRVEENLSFTPKDREEVIYIYMYRVGQNPNLQNRKRFRIAPIFTGNPEDSAPVYYHRPPLMLELFYLVTVHSKFRSDAERLLGWVLLRLNEATHLIYRPRRFILPDGKAVDSLGRPYDPDARDETEDLFMEKVSLTMVNDLTVGDSINMFTILEAPFRPFLTYRARIALDGPLYASSGSTTVSFPPLRSATASPPGKPHHESPSGRITGSVPPPKRSPPGPEAHRIRRLASDEPADTEK